MEVDGTRSGMGENGAVVQKCWLASADPWHGDERQFADHGWECAGGLFIHINMVAAVEEVYRARAFAEAVLRSWDKCENGDRGGASPSARASESGETSVL